ncbi:RNA polymerase sigma factor RpoH [Polynucleobacter sp. AP-Feld-500C-C5]|uniref:RNA polymerase sigma factor RpoH n=1 Tax=Polynucleobacter sp. AP-Feld-500C-C5 TaxID=2576924 RepID=UPI001C0D553B|nr:RNA polymerase sigma factor RpoH [Polynucleobacter sp. AP-Feld-500C-C5]MBU3633313.1 RNA polymerase sigma factor RpoH [Polynucleobacter sp. AP-Feld-500C-C5]
MVQKKSDKPNIQRLPVAQAAAASAFPMLPSLGVGTLDSYIAYVNRVPMLSAAEELHLAQEFRRTENVEAAKTLVLSHLRLVVSVARQYLGYGIPHADLIQEGNIGLMKAVKRYDPNNGARLVSYAIHWIKAEIHEYILKNWRLVKMATTKAQRKLFFNLRSNKPTLSALTPGEVDALAKALDVKGSDVKEMEMRLAGGDVALEGDDSDEEAAYAPIQWLADNSQEPTERIAHAEADALQGPKLDQALMALDERSRNIVQSRWLAMDADGNGTKTLHDLAAEYGISAERVRQIETAALKKMRGMLQAEAA